LITRRTTLKTFAATAALAVPALRAQTVMRQLTIVVAFPAGGATDAVARLVADGLRGRYADTVIVDNRVGGNGRIGAVHVKNGPRGRQPDAVHPGRSRSRSFRTSTARCPYDPLQDFVPVATTGKGAFALSVGPAVPASVRTVADFIAWCKANPDNATFGAPAGGGQHFAGVQFARLAGVPLRMVPYKGARLP
jgi:tripartite-type tricarboxylate transporter receptor subunit TctC